MGSSVATQSENTRRWQRQPVDLPLGVVTGNGQIGTVVPGRAIEISEGGMALYAGIDLEPGDLMAVEFRGPSQARVAGAIRSRSGYCFGLEFLTPVSAWRRVDERGAAGRVCAGARQSGSNRAAGARGGCVPPDQVGGKGRGRLRTSRPGFAVRRQARKGTDR